MIYQLLALGLILYHGKWKSYQASTYEGKWEFPPYISKLIISLYVMFGPYLNTNHQATRAWAVIYKYIIIKNFLKI